jgi:hypothetical protein
MRWFPAGVCREPLVFWHGICNIALVNGFEPQLRSNTKMRKLIIIVLLISFAGAVMAKDTLVTLQGKKYHGTVIDRRGGNWVIRTEDGSVVEIPESITAKIIRGNIVYDIQLGQKYYLEVRRPFLPFIVLGVAAGAYGYKRFNDYADLHKSAEAELQDQGQDVTNTKDQKTALAEGIASLLVCAGSFYIALRPLKVKVDMGTIELSLQAPRPGVMLSLKF